MDSSTHKVYKDSDLYKSIVSSPIEGVIYVMTKKIDELIKSNNEQEHRIIALEGKLNEQAK